MVGSCIRWRTNILFFFPSRRRHTRLQGDWSSDVCSSDLCCSYRSPPAKIPDPAASGLLSSSTHPGQEFPVQGVPVYCQIEPVSCCWYTPFAPAAKSAEVLGLSSSFSQPGQEFP